MSASPIRRQYTTRPDEPPDENTLFTKAPYVPGVLDHTAKPRSAVVTSAQEDQRLETAVCNTWRWNWARWQ